MLLFELTRLTTIDPLALVSYRAFVAQIRPKRFKTADYWSAVFGAPAVYDTSTLRITSLLENNSVSYTLVASWSICYETERSFYWDQAGQVLYIHFDHDTFWRSSKYQYGYTYGIGQNQVITIDDIFYLPLVKSVPSLAKNQDLINYNQLNFISGDVVVDNTGGDLDFVLDEYPYGNDCYISYIDTTPDVIDYSRSQTTVLAKLYVEKYNASQREVVFSVQDPRKAADAQVPNVLFSKVGYPYIDDDLANTPIPIMFGTVYSAPAICTNGLLTAGSVSYRLTLYTQSYGTVQVWYNDSWHTVTPTLENTSGFTLSSTDARNSDGSVRKVRCLNALGYSQTKPTSIIRVLNLLFLNVDYVSSNYDTTAWAAAEALFADISIYIPGPTTLYEVIRQIQQQSSLPFRYEFLPDGRRTVLLNDLTKAMSLTIFNEDILDIDTLGFTTDIDALAAKVIVTYAKDYEKNSSRYVINSDYLDYVLETYRLQPTLHLDSLLTTEANAIAKASVDAARFKDIRRLIDLTVCGAQYFGLKIFDMVKLVASRGFVDLDAADNPQGFLDTKDPANYNQQKWATKDGWLAHYNCTLLATGGALWLKGVGPSSPDNTIMIRNSVLQGNGKMLVLSWPYVANLINVWYLSSLTPTYTKMTLLRVGDTTYAYGVLTTTAPDVRLVFDFTTEAVAGAANIPIETIYLGAKTYPKIYESRKWLGVWKAQVIGTDPDLANNSINLRLALIDKLSG